MRITLDGESFDLPPELVRTRLAGHDPEGITEYWVEIDGRRWPVKQVVALATGARRGRFQSQDARRWLRNLQFPIGGGGSLITDGRARRARTFTPRRAFDASELEEIEALDVRVGFSWLHAGSVALDAEGLPLFPPLPILPGLYRYDFGVGDDGIRTLYIGESVNLARRGSNYRNAKSDNTRQRTSRRIHREIVSHLGDGGRIDFAIATSAHWQDGEELDLHRTSARRLAENAAVLLGQTEPGVRVLNIDTELERGEPTDD
ncbi:MAG: hypothetical protein B7X41_20555 [Microbacterium sp. 14-71-5]|nr:MAG: hypothetical protein B7X41_20555 [Microbacterium sp. 14-71-5]